MSILNSDDVIMLRENRIFHLYFFVKCGVLHIIKHIYKPDIGLLKIQVNLFN